MGKALTDTESIVSIPHIFPHACLGFYANILYNWRKYWVFPLTEVLADPVMVHKDHPKPHHVFGPLSRLQALHYLHSLGELNSIGVVRGHQAFMCPSMPRKRKDHILKIPLLRQQKKFIQLPVKCSREPSLAISLKAAAKNSGRGTTCPGTPTPAWPIYKSLS